MGKQPAESFKTKSFHAPRTNIGITQPGPLSTTCTTAAVWAGATPGGFWAALSPKNGGRSRPIWCFFRGASCFPAFRISDSGKKLLAPQTEEGAEEEAEGYSFCLLQVSPPICLREPQPDRLLR